MCQKICSCQLQQIELLVDSCLAHLFHGQALQAMFGEEMLCEPFMKVENGIRVVLKFSKRIDTGDGKTQRMDVRFELGDQYPLEAPCCEAQCEGLKRVEHDELASCIRDLIPNHAGRECVFDLLQEVETNAQRILKRNATIDDDDLASNDSGNASFERCLIQLDHMRDVSNPCPKLSSSDLLAQMTPPALLRRPFESLVNCYPSAVIETEIELLTNFPLQAPRYCKTVSKWAEEHSLSGCLLLHPRLIYIVLYGQAQDISRYLHLHRTQQVQEATDSESLSLSAIVVVGCLFFWEWDAGTRRTGQSWRGSVSEYVTLFLYTSLTTLHPPLPCSPPPSLRPPRQVDLDSRGRRCKERLLTVLARDCVSRGGSGEGVGGIEREGGRKRVSAPAAAKAHAVGGECGGCVRREGCETLGEEEGGFRVLQLATLSALREAAEPLGLGPYIE